ncbi:hypothetical protein Q9189_000193 [Teloschistes chrysophthalmus]
MLLELRPTTRRPAETPALAGPISESVPSSITGFAHARLRANSRASFTYMQGDEESSDEADEEAVVDQEHDEPFMIDRARAVESSSRYISLERRKSSGHSRKSAEDPLLGHRASMRTDQSDWEQGGRISQKIYIVTEDLTIVISGFATSLFGYVNQWGEFEVHNVARQPYGYAVSTVFGATGKSECTELDEDDDPPIPTLHHLDYRYMRFCFNPLNERFTLSSNWKDPSWTKVKSMRVGLDSDERYRREIVFGKNEISIKQKSIPQLLLDETMKKLGDISRFECDVRVIRNGFWRQVTSIELVPGDVYEVSDPSLTQLPCDSLLLAGDCIVNESMLTGESVPVSKTSATNESLRVMDLGASSIHPEAAKSFLFSGTKIIRARRPQDGTDEEAVALAAVARTGFNTTKGALVRSMLFPKPSGFRFYKDAFRYISVMAAFAAVGFVASLVNFVRLKLAWHLIIVRALDLITIVVPPALPATLTIGTNFALSRLKTKSIFCISPQRVNVGGKLDVVCFDKTGTLTEDGLDVLGVRVVHRSAKRFSDLLSTSSLLLPGTAYERDPTVDYDVHKAILYTMASCHSLRTVENNLVGDPLDMKMFGFTDWSFEEGTHDPFSVQTGDMKTKDCSIAKPPAGSEFDLDEAAGSNNVPFDWTSLQKMERDEAERGLDFIGFIIFENKLKPATAETIGELEAAGIRQVMCTGDNILTAISVARECALIDRTAHCFVPRFAEDGPRNSSARLKWQSVDNPLFELDERTLMPLPPPAEGDVSLPYDMSNLRNYTLAVTGDVFRWTVDFGEETVLRRMLVACQIFARMSPDEKHELVEKLQALDHCCGFCGDGANDCGALKAADVGISLSEAEASVAAPFTSQVFDISCVPEVIR